MGRPRKNRVGEYAQLLTEELQRQLEEALSQAIAESHAAYAREVQSLRQEVRALTKQVELLADRAKAPRPKVGKWVPGGPGRPPNDAQDRIAAFESRGNTRKKRGHRARKASEPAAD
jgi:hypothetical protein